VIGFCVRVARELLSNGRMRRLVFVLLLSFFSAQGFASDEAETIALAIGRSVHWPTSRGGIVTVSNGSIVRAVDFGSSLKITGKKLGSATISAGTRRADIHVLPEKVFSLYERLQHALKGRRGLKLMLQGQSLRITGRLLRWEDWRVLSEAAQGAEAEWKFEATLDQRLVPQAQAFFKSLLTQAHLPEMTVELQPRAALSLPTENADAKAKVVSLLAPWGFSVDTNPSAIALEPLVRVKIVVAEVKKSSRRQLGIKWPSSFAFQVAPIFDATNSLLVAEVMALEENGHGRILASPTLLCRSGKEAQFLAGGEFPIKLASFKNNDVIWKKHGIVLKIKPRADFSGRMSVGIETEVSMIDSSQTVDGIPGLLTNRIESHFDLSSSKTIALSGLIKKEWGESAAGLPGLTQLPILGSLFSSRDYRDHLTELVIFVTPEVVKIDQETSP
jgi:pilus assembly protein CpaC